MTDIATNRHPNFVLTVALCFLVAVVEGFDLQVMSAIGPMVRDQLQLNASQLGLSFSATLIGLAIGATTGGYISDRIGRKRVIVWSAFAMSLFTFATAMVDSYSLLFITRVLTGLSIGGAMPNTIVMITDSMADRRKPSAAVVTLMLCGIPTGGILAALASYALAESAGWRGILISGGVFSMIVAFAAQLGLPDTTLAQARKKSQQGLVAVLFGEGRATSTALLWIITILSLATVASLSTWLPTLAVDKGLGVSKGFATLLAWNLGGVCGILTIGKLCDLLGSRNALILAYLGMSAAFVLFTNVQTAAAYVIFSSAVNFFVAGSHYTVYGLSPRLYPVDGAGLGVGANMAVGRIGAISGPTIIGLFMHAGSTGEQVILGLVPMGVICAVLVFVLVITSQGKFDQVKEKAVGAAATAEEH